MFSIAKNGGFMLHQLRLLRLMKICRTVFFVEFLVPFFLAGGNMDMQFIALTFVSFALLLYQGIYVINDIVDADLDRKSEHKRKRPIASGHVSVMEAYFLALAFVGGGLFLGFLLSKTLFLFEVGFLAFNIAYSVFLKKIPIVDLFANGFTHFLRVYMGFSLAGESVNWPFAIGFMSACSAFLLLKRENEFLNGDFRNRKTLKFYSGRFKLMYLLLFIIMAGALFFSYKHALLILSFCVASFLFIAFYHIDVRVRGWWDYILKQNL